MRTIIFKPVFFLLFSLAACYGAYMPAYHSHENGVFAEMNEKVLPNLDVYVNKMELFLENKVPGLNASYRNVIDKMIHEGFDVYIQGGITRDLLDDKPLNPHDVDLYYTASPKELKKMLDKMNWVYATLPDSHLISIGEPGGITIDATPIHVGFAKEENTLEYTLTNIVYHFNTKTFLPGSETGLIDSLYKRLRVITTNWHDWLHEPTGFNYKKIFRFWKMVGKGYVYTSEFEKFIVEETLAACRRDGKEFNDKMLSYLSKNIDSIKEVSIGCASVMGQAWFEEHILAQHSEIQKKGNEFNLLIMQYTFNNVKKSCSCITKWRLH